MEVSSLAHYFWRENSNSIELMECTVNYIIYMLYYFMGNIYIASL